MLTERQTHLLEAIIKAYIETAEPVGSNLIVHKYDIAFSPATVRNEMAKLLEEGYLEMLHTSSGRVPTKVAYKLFLEELMEEQEMDVLEEVAAKQRLWANRYEFERMLKQASVSLSEMTHLMVYATTDDGYVISTGCVNILDYKEFWAIDKAKSALYLVDHFELLQKIFDQAFYKEHVSYVIGDELGSENLSECSMVFSHYTVGKRQGHIGVFGPARMNYQKIIPAVRYTKSIIEELGGSW